MALFTHILVPTDFSECSERALDTAIELARTFDARLTLLHAWTVPTFGYAEELAWPVVDLENAARRSLDDALRRCIGRHAQMDAILQNGMEYERILETIASRKIDLVVMGTHGRQGITRVVLGSVAEKIVRLSPVPVLTVGSSAKIGARP